MFNNNSFGNLEDFVHGKKKNDLDDKMLKRLRRNEVDPMVYSKNDMIQRHFEIEAKLLRRQLRLDRYRDKIESQLYKEKLNKLNSFKKFQYDLELNEQTNYMNSLVENKLKEKNAEQANLTAETSKSYEDLRNRLKLKMSNRLKLPPIEPKRNSTELLQRNSVIVEAKEEPQPSIEDEAVEEAIKFYDLDQNECQEVARKMANKRLTLLMSSSSNLYMLYKFNPNDNRTDPKPTKIFAKIDYQAELNKKSLKANYDVEKSRITERDKKIKKFLLESKKFQ